MLSPRSEPTLNVYVVQENPKTTVCLKPIFDIEMGMKFESYKKNYLDLLPEDILDKIYFEVHKKKYLEIIQYFSNTFKMRYNYYMVPKDIYIAFYKSSTSNKEVALFHEFVDWVYGSGKYNEDNKYFQLFMCCNEEYLYDYYIDDLIY